MQRHLFLIGYDIVCPDRRAAVLRLVKCHAIGGQKSFYECWYTSAEFQKAMHSVRTVINPDEDRVVFVRLDPRASIHTAGIAKAPNDADYFYVG
jgi:CRISPR-associated protein Cas2